ncbi:MbeB-like, N-term conserved region [Klebsiella pneumoniae]|nr:MbeB-like, N-term conserved region [Klebsiella pneumoniae]SLQ69475.1 MbeB-like, N-term conserved region [Klebsiella pneumoniae]
MSNLLQTGAEFEKKLKERAESTEKMLNNEFRRLGESVSEAVTSNETKIRDAIALFTASTEESLEKGVRLEKGNYPTLSAFFAQMATD